MRLFALVLLSVISASCAARSGQLSMQSKVAFQKEHADFNKEQQQKTILIDLKKTPEALDQTGKYFPGNVTLKAQLRTPAHKFWAKHVDQGYFARFLRFPNAKTSHQKTTITGGQESVPVSCFRKDFLKKAFNISEKTKNLGDSLLEALKSEYGRRGLSTKKIDSLLSQANNATVKEQQSQPETLHLSFFDIVGYNNCQFFKEKTLVKNVKFINASSTVLESYTNKSFPRLQYGHKALYTAGVKVPRACGCKSGGKDCAYPFTIDNTLQAVFNEEGKLKTAYPVQGKRMSMKDFNTKLTRIKSYEEFIKEYGDTKYGVGFYHMLEYLLSQGEILNCDKLSWSWVESLLDNYKHMKLFGVADEGAFATFPEFIKSTIGKRSYDKSNETLWQSFSKSKNNKLFDAYKERIRLILLSFLEKSEQFGKNVCKLKSLDISNVSFQIEMNKKFEKNFSGS